MSKIIFKSDSIRVQWSNTLPNNFNETSYFNTTVSNDGTNIILTNPNDPNFVDVEVLYADIVNPVTATITELEDQIRCEILTHTNRMIHFPESTDIVPAPCLGLQNVNNDLYWNGSLLSGGGTGLTTADNGLTVNPVGNVQINGPLNQNTLIDGIGAYTFTMSDLNGAEFSSNNGSNIVLQSDNGSGNTSTIYAGNNQITSSVYDAGANVASQIYGEYNNITLRTLDPDNTFTASVTATTSGLANSVSNNTSAVNTLINQTENSIVATYTDSITNDYNRLRILPSGASLEASINGGNVSTFSVLPDVIVADGGFTQGIVSIPLTTTTLPAKKNFYFIDTNGGAGAFTLTIPIENCFPGYEMTIKDETGFAGSRTMSITTALGAMEYGAPVVINQNGGFVKLVYTGSTWLVVNKGAY